MTKATKGISLSFFSGIHGYLAVIEWVVGGRELISTSHPFDVGSGLAFVFMEESGSGEQDEPLLPVNSRFVV